ncbi:hypothetical protein RBI80_13705 [Klebsiella variicola]|nr:hypothetical protein RBI80_13705 [Klebsiella variicola]
MIFFFSTVALCPATQKPQPWTVAAINCTVSRSAADRLLLLFIAPTVIYVCSACGELDSASNKLGINPEERRAFFQISF